MTINKLYLWGRKIHRLAMWLAVVLGVPLALTGLLLDDGGGRQIRLIHRLVSKPFAITLAVMIMTGIVMWGVPVIIKNPKPTTNSEKRA